MTTNLAAPASRSKRFWAFAIDQTILSIIGIVVFAVIIATQIGPISNTINTFFGDPLWLEAEQLSQSEFDTRLNTLMTSEKVTESIQSLAHPFALVNTLTLILSAAYYIIPTKKWGATPGKRWLKISVQDLDGSLPDWWQSSARYFSFIGFGTFGGIVILLDLIVNKAFLPSNITIDILVSLLSQATLVLTLVSIIMITAREDRRGLHDLLAHTIVRDISKPIKQS